jgi:membrane protein implicated in regulation of membrane protease activity
MSAWIWLLLAVVFAVVEITNLAFFALFAVAGALAAALTAGVGGGIVAQTVVFAGTSIGGVVVLRRPLMNALGTRRAPALRSGVSGLVGLNGTVVTRVDGLDHPGAVHVRGEDWAAVTYDDHPYEPGEVVHILDVERTRLVVTTTA